MDLLNQIINGPYNLTYNKSLKIVYTKTILDSIKLLESKKYKVVPKTLRHMYTQGGGIHCATLDTVRESKLDSYFD